MPYSLKLLYIHLLAVWFLFVFVFVLHFQAPDAGEAVLANKNQFRRLDLRWELDHVTPGLWAVQSHSSATGGGGALGPAVAFKIPGHLVLLPKAGLGRPLIPLASQAARGM